MPAPTDFRTWTEECLMELADDILRGRSEDQDTIFRLAKALKNRWKRFDKARRLLWLARSPVERVTNKQPDKALKLCQQHALCTYKDPDLPAYQRFDRAMAILREGDLSREAEPDAQITQETLGIAGAVFKAQWEAFGQRSHLERSLAYYCRGWQQGLDDDGYTGVNAAYLMDLIAYQEETEANRSGTKSVPASRRRRRAHRIRGTLLAMLPGKAKSYSLDPAAVPADGADAYEAKKDGLYWILVTLGEACIGLGLKDEERFNQCKEYFSAARALERDDWMVESTARQIASLTRYLEASGAAPPGPGSREWESIGMPDRQRSAGGAQRLYRQGWPGAVGRRFRAALFHIGVLARLAELDMLRHVEYLSCVSGGSIIGAYFYLEVRKMLEENTDGEIKPKLYVELIRQIEEKFLAGVQQNLRVQALSDFRANFHHDVLSGVLPTEKVAELYDTLLYSRVTDDRKRDISELRIHPRERKPDGGYERNTAFRPKEDNWRREHKAPILILNATTLNTGHNWQFTTTWMGEPPATANEEIDANPRLRRMYYSEAPDKPRNYRQFPLGRAVGASAAVPALFTPVELPDLFPGFHVRLVDGGVHDNQGVASLIDQGCTVILVSDASGQLEDQAQPGARLLNTAVRADEILQERVRVAQYQDLESRRRSGLLRSLMFLHLKKDLEADPQDWINCFDPHEASDEAKPAGARAVGTRYGVHRKVQRKLAAIRTDLDAFHDTEAWALMCSGYLMTKYCFPEVLREAASAVPREESWRFLAVLPAMKQPDQDFLNLLGTSSQQLFKIWSLDAGLRRIGVTLIVSGGLTVAALLAFGLFWKPPVTLLTSRSLTRWVIVLLLVIAGAKVLGPGVMRWLDLRGTVQEVARRGCVAWIVARTARLHMAYLNDKYLSKGLWKSRLSTPACPAGEDRS